MAFASSGAAAAALTSLFVLSLAAPVDAALVHVLPSGERTTGASIAGDWSAANCYASLALAALAASPNDTILLSRDDHELSSLIVAGALVANRDLDFDPTACRVLLNDDASVQVQGGTTAVVLRGIEFSGGTRPTSLPAVRVLAPPASGTSLLVESCAFTNLVGSVGTSGGSALHVVGGSERVTVTLHDSRFQDCSAGGSGGAVYAGDGVDLQIASCEFLRNEARFAGVTVLGGALALVAASVGSSLTLEDCSFVDSISWGPAGAIYVQDAPLTMRDTEIRGSRSAFGGVTNWSAGAGVFLRRVGVDPQPIALIAERCRFVDNRGDLSLGVGGGDGGGMMIRGSDEFSQVLATIVDCHFEANFNDQGAGLYVGRGVNATIERTYFLGNTAHSNGGAAYKGGELSGNIGETALFAYCVFVGNRAGWDQNGQPIAFGGLGGAFMVRLNPRAEFHNCTFVDNLSGPNGNKGDAILVWNEGQAITEIGQRSRLVNCLFYGTHSNAEQVRVEFNGVTEIVNSAWEPGQLIAILAPTPGKVELDGSPFVAADDWRLLEDSPCVDAGAHLDYSIDIAGTPVPTGAAPEIGAFEHLTLVSVPGAQSSLASWVRMDPIHPNPANPRAVISFTIDRSASVRVTVHDLAGRHVALLTDRTLSAGDHRLVWDGRDATGEGVASGLYLVRLVADEVSSTQKLVLVR